MNMSDAFLLPTPFRWGDRVEVASTEEGFIGSYYEATVETYVARNSIIPRTDYIVRYATLVKDDFSGPLTEFVSGADVRPTPPRITTGGFRVGDAVDAFANDGWWAGIVTGVADDKCKCRVFFASTGDEIWYPSGRLRFHQDWINGSWVCGKELFDRKWVIREK